ncbi:MULTISPECIES: GFA family protein [unclassified Acidovorax]|uniref:GFA family protein n=1 Tax=unclassified Acidovorax TaxID=2684926 RepID=UPI00288311BC|nr:MULTISPECIES: GFA family protein [unclassified Acidovorax]
MHLEGSCHCGAVRFSVTAHEPVPFMRCYCSICRKTAGTGGYAINLGADRKTLQIEGAEHLAVYRAVMPDGSRSPGERNFCQRCGTAMWMFDPRWPDLVHPHAGAVDTPLPPPPASTHMMLKYKPDWVDAHVGSQDETFDEYGQESLAEWHRRHQVAS